MPLIDPIAQYPTTQLGRAAWPPLADLFIAAITIPGLQGKYVFGDLNRGDGSRRPPAVHRFRGLRHSTCSTSTSSAACRSPSGASFTASPRTPSGELYFLFGNGQIMKLVPEPATWAIFMLAALIFCGLSRRRRFAG